MELRHLRAFLAVAEELHFGRAASRLRLSAAPVSRTVAELERELGLPLFVRSHHRVALTEAGSALLPDARGLLTGWTGFTARGRALAQVSAPTRIRLGAPSLAPPGALDLVVDALAATTPDVPVDVDFASTTELLRRLRRRDLDLVIATLPLYEADLDVLPVARYVLGVALPEQHELAGREMLDADDLAGQVVLIIDSEVQPATVGRTHQWLVDIGATVEQLPDADLVRRAQLVRHGRGIALTSLTGPSAHVFGQPGLRIVPLSSDALATQLGLVRRKRDEREPWVDALVQRLGAGEATGFTAL